ncbi:MAG: hypothetical protein GJV46_06765 [Geobacter sp.]|nr:hypothetical protein [Geobacter sp.]
MKRISMLCLLFLLIIPAFSLAAVIGPARVSLIDGEVMFRTPDSDEWIPAAINTPLDEGDAIWCSEDSRAEIQLADGSLIRIDENSQLDMLAFEDGFTHLHLASGRAYVRTSQRLAVNALQIDADDTTVLPAARTRLRLDMFPNSQEDISIFKGSAYVEGNGNSTRVRAGEHIVLEEDRSAVLALNPPDSWENWNMNRDRDLSRSARSKSYLPEELQSYSTELDSNGRWVRVPEYGMVWRPADINSDDWAPYRSGRWIWKGDDYVWVSYESWGWIPYHFGRWAVVSGIGWCWVPPLRGDVYWGPGYVGWYRTGGYVGWTPLAPGEPFYGRRHYGRNSINITTTTVSNRNVTYRNRNVRGGMTVIPQNDFLRGRVVAEPAPRKGSGPISVSVSIGSPRLQPSRETRMPIIKHTPPRFAPPRIEHRDNRELRQRFPRITPETTPQPRQRQTSPVAPSQQQPATRTIQTAPSENRVNQAPQQQNTPRQNSDRRTAPSATQQVPAQPAPTVSGSVPQQNEPQQRTTNQPTPRSDQSTAPAPARGEQRQRGSVPEATTETKSAPSPRAEHPKRESRPREFKEKKVWRVDVPDEGRDQEPRERGNRDRGERRSR